MRGGFLTGLGHRTGQKAHFNGVTVIDTTQTPYYKGYKAFLDYNRGDTPMPDNPFVEGSNDYGRWVDGYGDALGDWEAWMESDI
jgi:hypothetical protein